MKVQDKTPQQHCADWRKQRKWLAEAVAYYARNGYTSLAVDLVRQAWTAATEQEQYWIEQCKALATVDTGAPEPHSRLVYSSDGAVPDELPAPRWKSKKQQKLEAAKR